MNDIKIQHYKNVNMDKIKFHRPTKNTTKFISKCWYIADGEQKKFVVQTPKLKLNDDLKYDKVNGSFNLNCLFSKNQSKFSNFIHDIEQFLINSVTNNSKEWFDVRFNKLNTTKLFRSMITSVSQTTFLLKTKIINYNLFSATTGKKVAFIMSLNSIIFEEDIFYADWIINQVKIFDSPENKYMFIDDCTTDDESLYDIINSEITEITKSSLDELDDVENQIKKTSYI